MKLTEMSILISALSDDNYRSRVLTILPPNTQNDRIHVVWVIFICTCGVRNHTLGLIIAYDHIKIAIQPEQLNHLHCVCKRWAKVARVTLYTWFLSSMKFLESRRECSVSREVRG